MKITKNKTKKKQIEEYVETIGRELKKILEGKTRGIIKAGKKEKRKRRGARTRFVKTSCLSPPTLRMTLGFSFRALNRSDMNLLYRSLLFVCSQDSYYLNR